MKSLSLPSFYECAKDFSMDFHIIKRQMLNNIETRLEAGGRGCETDMFDVWNLTSCWALEA